MKSIFTYVLVFLSGMVLMSSCKGEPEILKSIEGNWYCVSDGVILKETWEALGKGHLTGVGYKVEEGVESVEEYLELKKVEGKLTYIASVPEQNEGKPVSFSESAATSNSITFENAEHDFPQFITYEIIDDANMLVTIGLLPSTESSKKYELHFSRNSPEMQN